MSGLRSLATVRSLGMTTLRIEHAIHDYALWRAAFDRFAEARDRAGVRSFAIRRPVDDPEVPRCSTWSSTRRSRRRPSRRSCRERVWSSPEASPALAGTPQTRILEMLATD